MARYKPYDYHQTQLIPVSLEHQLLQGTLEHTIHHLVDHTLDLSLFDGRYTNDETGCPAYDPKMLLKVVLFAYSRGMIGSRRIEWLCRQHVICMALACMQHPDHRTIAAFVSSMHAEILTVFCEILLVCEEQQLLGGTVFALDGLKLSSNASKEWSGTLQELQHKQAKLEAKIAQLLAEHQQVDDQDRQSDGQDEGLKVTEMAGVDRHHEGVLEALPQAEVSPDDGPTEEVCQPEASPEGDQPAAASQTTEVSPTTGTLKRSSSTRSGRPKRSGKAAKRSRQQRQQQKRVRRLTRLRRQAERLTTWLATHEPRIGRQGTEIQSNITDPESAKMPTSHGVVQGYNAQALVDDAYQVIVATEVFGDGQDAQHLTRMMARAKATIQGIGHGADYFAGATVLADSNYFSDDNLTTCEQEHLNAYIPDGNFRKRDPRFANQARYTPKKTKKKQKRFGVEDFTYDEATLGYRCPNGARLRLKAREHRVRHQVYRYYAADEQDCQACRFRTTCLSQKQTKCKHWGIPVEDPVTKPKSRCQQMMAKIDTPEGRQQYSRRLAIVEPVFANLRTQKGLDHFTLRGKEKVDIQWMLYAMVHNIEKIAHYGAAA